jgi:UDP-N-acetylmuramate dehydrogenase
LKKHPGEAVVVSATFGLVASTSQACKEKIRGFVDQRQQTQPAGASMGSMFKNPPSDYAGRLIEQAGLKGLKRGGAQISQQHANFFVNLGDARAEDVFHLIMDARRAVKEQFGVELELEIELIGDWNAEPGQDATQGVAA